MASKREKVDREKAHAEVRHAWDEIVGSGLRLLRLDGITKYIWSRLGRILKRAKD